MNKVIDRLEEFIIGSLMALATIIIFISVVHRYGSGFAIPGVQDWLLSIHMGWAQELCLILFVWMAKFGAAYGVRTGIHVGVDLLINKLEGKPQEVLIQIGLFAGVFFTGVIAVFGAVFVWENGMAYETLTALGRDAGDYFEGPITPDLEWPTWRVYAAIPLGSGLMCFRFIQAMIRFHKTGELPHHDHGHVDGIEEPAPDMLGEAIEAFEEREHAHHGKSDAEWDKTHPKNNGKQEK